MKILDVPQSGSTAGTTSSRNRFGQYRRSRAMPTQPRTVAQVNVRANLSTVSQAWRDLTDAQRIAWANYSAGHTRLNSLGVAVVLSGHMMFVAVNSLNLTAGLAIQNTVPDGTPQDAMIPNITATTVAGFSMDQAAVIPVADTVLVYSSPPLSPGRAYNGDFRLVATVTGTNAANQVLLTAADLVAKFGVLAVNQKFFFSLKRISGGNASPLAADSVVLT